MSSWVHTSGVTPSQWPEEPVKRTPDKDGMDKSKQLDSQCEPLAKQVHTFKRGMALAALQLPAQEQQEALRDVLEMVGMVEPRQASQETSS